MDGQTVPCGCAVCARVCVRVCVHPRQPLWQVPGCVVGGLAVCPPGPSVPYQGQSLGYVAAREVAGSQVAS